MPVSIALAEDIPRLVALINSAYRGEASRRGWTTEADLVAGEMRTDIPALTEIMGRPASVVLKYTNDGNIIGSVLLEIQDSDLYLGMLTVSPLHQASGIGKQLMKASEEFARHRKLSSVFMNVISARQELIAWYERQGYHLTGERKPFPADHRFGIPLQSVEFAIMKKTI